MSPSKPARRRALKTLGALACLPMGLLRRIKEQRADLPVIMVTAYGDDERRRKAQEFGAAEFVTKPVDFNLLKRQLQQLPVPP